jgi:hypothetical protein
VVKFVISPFGFTAYARNFIHGGFQHPIHPPPSHVQTVYTEPNTFVFLEFSEDGMSWLPASAQGNLAVTISNTAASSSIGIYNTEMFQLNLFGNGAFGPFMIRESPTKQSLGMLTMRPDSRGYRISSLFDVNLELSMDNGQTWIPADRSIRVQPSPPAAAPNSIFISHDGNMVTLDWLGTFQLQSAPKVDGPYADMGGVTMGPITMPTGPDPMFFRLRQ